MPLTHQQILDFVRANGPSVPNDIRQALKAQDNFVVGAMLGELTSQGKLKMTDLSLGTSRFYYDPSAPEKLETVGQYLNEKDLRAFTLLKDSRVLRHTELEPIMRVAMVNIPDYSRAVRYRSMTADGSDEELFWRYYLVPELEAIAMIEQKWFGKRAAQAPVATPSPPPTESAPAAQGQPDQTIRFGKKVARPVQEPVPVPKKIKKTVPAASPSVPSEKPTGIKAEKPVKPLEGFAKQVTDYFATKDITVTEPIKATKTELTVVVTIPSAVGGVTYFCKAKAKKAASDGDLASALLEAQHRKLPLFYVAGGTLSKKAQAILTTELKGIVAVTPWA